MHIYVGGGWGGGRVGRFKPVDYYRCNTNETIADVFRIFQVIRDRQKEYEEQISKNNSAPASVEACGDDEVVYTTIGNRNRLAFLDMLLQVAHKEGNLSVDDIREEVDTFMFEVYTRTPACYLLD